MPTHHNPLAGLVEYRNTLVSAMELAGFKDPNRFFKDPAQQPPQPQEPPKPDINEQLIQVQMAEIQEHKWQLVQFYHNL